VDGGHRSTVAQFFTPAAFGLGSAVTLGPDAAHHMNVLRLAFGARVAITDGAGHVGGGSVVRLGRREAQVAIDEVWSVPQPAAVHMMVPVADRDRMLWMAEKCAELSATSWRPIMWQRSASVSPSGVGPRFREKVHGRMEAALTQSRGAWLPDQRAEQTPAAACADLPPGLRLLLDPAGRPLLQCARGAAPLGAVTIAVGPEGGLEESERALLLGAGFVQASLAETILRFETAGVAALAAVRAALAAGVAPTAVVADERGSNGSD
jgi:16S rRNA (uracil1498-N3)-methyltransferase